MKTSAKYFGQAVGP